MDEGMDRLVKEWLRLDKDVSTRKEIENLAAQNNVRELESRMKTRIQFGTAGLRARMEAGFSRLNCLTVIQTSQGLAQYLIENAFEAKEKGIVIGYDARHNSSHFAELAAAAFVAKGIRVWWYDDPVHTPLVPFAVRELGSAAGVMITASHNPASDNGYKVYAGNGCQINSPADAKISASILQNLEPITWDAVGPQNPLMLRQRILTLMINEYSNKICQMIHFHERKPPAFVYTPLHGVGLRYMLTVAKELEIDQLMTVVEEQALPDPNFPTVKYPNPEEKGALDLAVSTASSKGVNLVLANDPDADRFAAAEKVGSEWHQFTGDEIGVLLGYFLFQKAPAKTDYVMLTSTVSSQMLSEIGKKEGFKVEECLTGFKWLGNRAIDVMKQGKAMLFAYEEALGYMTPDIVLDKDGVMAAALFLEACSQSGSPYLMLGRLYQKFGFFKTLNTYWRSPSIDRTANVFKAIRGLGTPFPEKVGGRSVNRWRDLTNDYDSETQDKKAVLPASADIQMITCWLSGTETDDGIRFTVRTSGTEPKIKLYLESRAKKQEDGVNAAYEMLRTLKLDWFYDSDLRIEEKCRNL